MNEAFNKSKIMKRKFERRNELIAIMKKHGLMACHIKIDEPLPLSEHALKDEVFEKIKSDEIVFN